MASSTRSRDRPTKKTRSTRIIDWRKAPVQRILLATLLVLAIARVSAADALLDSLDLSRPGLENVKAAVNRKDLPAARSAFADYLRHREKPKLQSSLPSAVPDDSL